jgi:hypothetical protein
MKLIAELAVAVLGLCGPMAAAPVQAQVVAPSAPPTEPAPAIPPPPTPPVVVPIPPPPTPPVTVVTPPPIHIETTVDLRSGPSPQSDPRAAREEAVNALHWAKTEGCRSDPSPRDCVRRAQDEYNATMARLGPRR